MSGLGLFDWMDKVRPNEAGISFAEKAARKSIRARVLKKSKCTWNALLVAKSRQSIGAALFNAVKDATQLESEEYRISQDHSETKVLTVEQIAASKVKSALKKLKQARDYADEVIEELEKAKF